jgi:hypothetical protein
MRHRVVLFTLGSILLLGLRMEGADIHVATNGQAEGNGSPDAPLSLAAAQQAARKLAGREPVTVHVAPGIYYLPEALVFTAADSGTGSAPVIYQANAGGQAVLSGGQRMELEWQLHKQGIYRARVPAGLTFDQLWVNGERQPMARFPNAEAGPGLNVFDTWQLDERAKADPARDPLAPERVAAWAEPAGGYFHALHPYLWGGVHWRITGKKPDGSLAMEGGTQNNRGSGIHRRYRMVENIFEELDAPGEWHHDSSSGWLYYFPRPGADLSKATIEVVRLRHLIELRGSQEQPVANLHFRGFTFRHTARTFMETKEPLLRSDWTIYRGGAVFINGAEDCSLSDCAFDQVGGNTIFVSGYNRRISIRGCLIQNSGANGIAFVGEVKAVRSPLLNYDEAFSYEKLDRTPGPLTDDYPADCLVEDCLITRIGRVEKQTAGVQIAMARRITIRHCSIYDLPRAGINIGDGCWGGHVVEFCDVFDTVLETGDHGSFNSWGRDRYWHPDRNVVNREVAADPGLPFLDMLEPIILRNNRWRCDHGWDVDLDDGSSRYRIYNNLFLNGGLKLREGYDRVVWNNIAINNTLHPHVWFSPSGDIVTNNLWMAAYRPAIMPGGKEKWGELIDFNFFASTEKDRQQFLAHGCDANSIVADPLFIDPASGDFRFQESSPALKLGMRNFPIDKFGVRKPALRAIARTPVIPPVRVKAKPAGAEAAPAAIYQWRGATLRQLSGDEFSAHGVARGTGGVALIDVPEGSQAAGDGLRSGDLIAKVGDDPVGNMNDLARLLEIAREQGAAAQLTVIRKQSPVGVKIFPATTPAK